VKAKVKIIEKGITYFQILKIKDFTILKTSIITFLKLGIL
jgi:hypothetical protein